MPNIAPAWAQQDTGPAQNEAPAQALPGPQPAADDVQTQLQAIRNSIALSQKRTEQLKAEIAKLEGDRAEQNAQLIAAGQRVKLAEIEAGAAEEKLTGLLEQEKAIRDRLGGADSNVAALLSTLQNISKTPPPALLVAPQDALASARGALLLSDILPQLSQRASAVRAELQKLLAVREQAQQETDKLRTQLTGLQEERLRVATLIEARKKGLQRAQTDLAQEQKQAQELAAKASSLEALVKTLSETVPAVKKAAEAADNATPAIGTSTGVLTAQTVKLALADTARTQPAYPISRAKGFLSPPVAGVTITAFGDNDGFGGRAHGVSIVTRAEAQVLAPTDGWVMYKGPYLNYGHIVILNPGQGYSIVLAGLEHTDVELGQFVLQGEPIGIMGTKTTGKAVSTSAGVSRPTLYIELRDANGPIDPEGWWASNQEQTRNG